MVVNFISRLTFSEPDMKTFVLLPCAIDCITKGGALPAVLNAANEVAVAEFLKGNIGFYSIFEIVYSVVDSMQYAKEAHTLDSILEYDREARRMARKLLLR